MTEHFLSTFLCITCRSLGKSFSLNSSHSCIALGLPIVIAFLVVHSIKETQLKLFLLFYSQRNLSAEEDKRLADIQKQILETTNKNRASFRLKDTVHIVRIYYRQRLLINSYITAIFREVFLYLGFSKH